MRCSNCGVEIKKEYKYCPECRAMLIPKNKTKERLKEIMFIISIICGLIPFLLLLIVSIQNCYGGVQKEFLCLDACEPTILYGKEAFFYTVKTSFLFLFPVFIGSIILIIVSIINMKVLKFR